jgi:uncharacterized protein (DUF983 family)
MFGRALLLRCPWCGSRKTFIHRWLGRHDRCRTCGIKWHREHGFELGPTALNVVITFFLLGVGMVVAFVATAPDYNAGVLTAVFIGLAIIIPVIAYPWTYTIWLAVDLAAHPPDAKELDAAAAAVANA